ncbi:MAG: hypothetical protein V9G08_12710 [Dermatophilaceae bacterium]
MIELDLVLPLPADAGDLGGIADALGRAGAWTDSTSLARHHGFVPLLASTWSGSAYEAAKTEAATAGRRCVELAGSFAGPAGALRQFALDVATATNRVVGLREEWTRAERVQQLRLATPPDDPVAALALTRSAHLERERVHADLTARHAQCVAQLRDAESRTAATLRAAIGAQVTPGAARHTLLDRLPMTDGAGRAVEAQALVWGLLAGLPPEPSSWKEAQWSRFSGLGDRVNDPYVALALVEALGPDTLAWAMGSSRWDPAVTAEAHVAPLGTALLTALSTGAARDPAWTTRRDSFGAGLVSGDPGRLADLAELLSHGEGRATPTVAFTVAALGALLRADRVPQDHPLIPDADVPVDSLAALGKVDTVAALIDIAGRDPVELRAVLLDAGSGAGTLLHRLVVDRPLAHASTGHALASSAVLGRRMVELAADPDGGLAQRLVSDAFLQDLGEVALATGRLAEGPRANVTRHLLPLGAAAAQLLAREPGRVSAVLSFDLTAEQRGRSIERMQAVLGQVGTASLLLPTTEGEPAPLGRVMDAVVAHETAKVAATPPGPAQDRAAARVGESAGLVLGSAVQSTAAAAADLDAVHGSMRQNLANVLSLVPLAESAIPGGKVIAKAASSDLLVKALVDLLTRDIPDDARQRATDAAAVMQARTSDLVVVSVSHARSPLAPDDPEPARLADLANAAIANGIRDLRGAPPLLPTP